MYDSHMRLSALAFRMVEASLADDALWSSRSWHWRDQRSEQLPCAQETSDKPSTLILSGFGVSLRIEGGTLRIRNGFTHHPQKQETFRFFKGDLDLSERIVLLDCTGSLSFDVMEWLAEQGVTLIKLNWRGRRRLPVVAERFFRQPFPPAMATRNALRSSKAKWRSAIS